MPNDLAALADKVREDYVSGSSETAAYVLDGLHRILTDNEASQERLLEFAGALRKAKPAMAPLSNIARMIETAARSPGPDRAALLWVERVIANERSAVDRISENAMEKVGGTVLTLSYSGTVVRVLEMLAKKKDLKVVVAESLPLGEGKRTAELLSGSDIDVTMISDSMVYAEARDSDLCLLGADAITPPALINKVGTYGIALASMQAGIPVYVVSSTLKITSELRPGWNIQQRTDGKYKVRSQIFEPTPLELISRGHHREGPFERGPAVLIPQPIIWMNCLTWNSRFGEDLYVGFMLSAGGDRYSAACPFQATRFPGSWLTTLRPSFSKYVLAFSITFSGGRLLLAPYRIPGTHGHSGREST